MVNQRDESYKTQYKPEKLELQDTDRTESYTLVDQRAVTNHNRRSGSIELQDRLVDKRAESYKI